MFLKSLCYLSIVLLCVTALITGCQDNGTDPSDEDAVQKTISSLEKVSEFPFYTMTYYIDYHFDEFLETGDRPDTPSDIIFTQHGDYHACTCVSAAEGINRVFGRNQDSYGGVTVALLLFTDPPDGYASLSMVWTPCLEYDRNHLPDSTEYEENLILAPYYSTEGMNEKGVAIADMSVPYADPPYDPEKVTIYVPDLVRLVLDYAENVESAITLISLYNINFFDGSTDHPVHTLIADASGNSAVIEWIDGRMRVIQDDNSWQVSTNFVISGVDIPDDVTCWRYKKAYSTLQACDGSMDQGETMNLMKSVSVSGTTWSCVYDLTNKTMQIALNRDYENVYSFSL